MNKSMSVKSLTLVGMGIALNVIGAFIALTLRLPIYLDSIGTILIASLLAFLSKNDKFPFPHIGNFIPNFWMSLNPSGQSEKLGVPRTFVILLSWSNSLTPGKRGFKVYNSVMMHPIAHTSILQVYEVDLSTHSGALYHLVQT